MLQSAEKLLSLLETLLLGAIAHQVATLQNVLAVPEIVVHSTVDEGIGDTRLHVHRSDLFAGSLFHPMQHFIRKLLCFGVFRTKNRFSPTGVDLFGTFRHL